MVDANFFCHQKNRKVKLDKVREGLRPITLRFRANARKLILGAIGTPLDHLSVKINHWETKDDVTRPGKTNNLKKSIVLTKRPTR